MYKPSPTCRCRVMGILNATPDSFSDGGLYFSPEAAVRHAFEMVADGADIVDVGGESTRPGATPVDWKEEWERIRPVLEGIRDCGRVVSVDTRHPETAELAVAAGAKMINCVYAEPVPDMVKVMERSPSDVELVMPVSCLDGFAHPDLLPRIYIDPMVGFGTTREEDADLIRAVPRFVDRARVLVGVSRKRIVRTLSGEQDTSALLGGNIALAIWCAAAGASVVRVHDVKETVQALRVWHSISEGGKQHG